MERNEKHIAITHTSGSTPFLASKEIHSPRSLATLRRCLARRISSVVGMWEFSAPSSEAIAASAFRAALSPSRSPSSGVTDALIPERWMALLFVVEEERAFYLEAPCNIRYIAAKKCMPLAPYSPTPGLLLFLQCFHPFRGILSSATGLSIECGQGFGYVLHGGAPPSKIKLSHYAVLLNLFARLCVSES